MPHHIGRAWTGHAIEDECPCGKAPCGLVDQALVDPACLQHAPTKTLRQGHDLEHCPGAPKPASSRTEKT